MLLKDKIDQKIGRKYRKVLEQFLHVSWSFLALLPILLISSPYIAFPLAGLLFALPRELVDQYPIDDWKDTLLDTSMFAVGGLLVSFLF